MPSASNALLKYEASQAAIENEEMTDSGDHTVYTAANGLWSRVSGFEPVIKPNGIKSGFNLLSATANNNEVSCKAFTAYFAGVEVSVAADSSITLTRDASLDYQKFSVICDNTGTLTIIESDAHASAFSTTRGAAGGPPSIPLAQIEIGQIWLTSNVDAPIDSGEIKQSAEANQQERYDYPVFEYNSIGDGNEAESNDKENAYLEFSSALEVSHGATANSSATAPKPVYIDYAVPTPVTISESVDFVPAQVSTSVSSTQIYRKSIGATSDTLGAASFTAYLEDGITDNLAKNDGKNLLFWFYPDKNKAPYMITQGVLRLVKNYPVDANINAACTIAAQQKSVNFDA